MLFLLLMMVFGETVLIILVLYSYIEQKNTVERLGSYFKWENKSYRLNDMKLSLKQKVNLIGKRIINILMLKQYREKIQNRLESAGLPINAEEMIFITSTSVIIIVCVILFSTHNLLLSTSFGILVILIVLQIIAIKAKIRLNQINEQLGSALDMISSSLRAGFSILRSMEEASRQMPKPISSEFAKVVKEIALGFTVDNALENFQNRLPLEDLKLLVTAIVMQRQVGGNLAEVLDNISNTIHERIKLKREIKTLTAQGRISGYIVTVIPAFIATALFFIDPDYISVLFKSSIGLILIGIALSGEIVGFLIIRKLLDVQY